MQKTPKSLEILKVARFDVFTAALLNIPSADAHKYATNFILKFQLQTPKCSESLTVYDPKPNTMSCCCHHCSLCPHRKALLGTQ